MVVSEIGDRVMSFVSNRCGVDVNALRPDATLVGDLCMEGALGLEFLMEFEDEFKVEMSRFEPSKYFGPDSGLVPRFVLKLLGIYRDPPELIPIRMRDLVEAAERGAWNQ
jgi:hypothetical protein